MKKIKPNTNYQPYEIDTGFINSELELVREEYPSDIMTIFRATLMTLLTQKNIVTIPFSEENAAIIEQLGRQNPPGLWDLTYFRFWYQNNPVEALNQKPYITHFNESCLISKNEEIFGFDSFDLYFALRLNLTDLMQTFNFLDYQLGKNFENNFAQFKVFLEQLIRKYKHLFLKEAVVESVVSWLGQDRQTMFDKTQELEKIEWLGTQKELAELFLELKRKGWLKDIPIKLIQMYFTESNSIDQVLNPYYDRLSKLPTYEKIFTPKYKPKFDTIRNKSTDN